MSLFEFVTVMISMILALSMGQVLTSASYLVKTGRPVRWYLPHTLWLICLGLTLVNHWWALWDFNALDWNYVYFLYILLAPVLIVFAVGLLAPDRAETGPIDLAGHFERVRRPFAAVMFCYIVAMWFDGPLLAGQDPLGVIGLLHVPMLLVFALAFFSGAYRANLLAPCVIIFMLLAIMARRFVMAL